MPKLVFNPVSGVFDFVGSGGSGITFPDLASPPVNTALGAFATPYSSFNTIGSEIKNYYSHGSIANFGGAFVGVPTNIDDSFYTASVITWGSLAHADYATMTQMAISDGYAGGEFDWGFVAAIGDYAPAGNATPIGSIWAEVNDTTNQASMDMAINLNNHYAFMANSPGDVAIGRAIANYSSYPVTYTGNLVIDGISGSALFKSTVTATDFIVSGSAFKTDTTNAHTALFQAYDVDGTTYKTFITLTNANTPTCDISAPSGGTLSGNFTTLQIGGVNVLTGSGAVTSLAGTANQITANAATGAVTLSIPTNPVFSGTALTFPGLLSIASGKTHTVNQSITLAGTDSTTMTFPTTSASIARIDADSLFVAAQSITVSGLAAVSTDGFVIANTTAATSGVPVQQSPRLRFRSQVWNTTSVAATNTNDFFIESVPASSSIPNGLLKFGSSLNSASATFPMTLTSGGAISLLGTVNTAGNFNGTGNSSELILFNGGIHIIGDANDVMAQRRSTTAQAFRIYNTFTTVDTAGEWFAIDWKTTANIINLQAVKGSSSGTARVLNISYGGLQASPSAAISIPITSGNITFGGGITLPGGATFLTTNTALTDGAGIGAGTLTTAPAAGNPTKWIGINDNGTTRYIPAW